MYKLPRRRAHPRGGTGARVRARLFLLAYAAYVIHGRVSEQGLEVAAEVAGASPAAASSWR
eukprot:15411764-Alexandrium_andersonii.AAC.1